MRQEFYILTQKLDADPLCAVSVFDTDNFTQVVRPTLSTDLKTEYGSIKAFFETINSKGHKNLLIQEYRKNGSSMSKKGNPFQVNFSEKENTQPQNPAQNNNAYGLNGASFGLGFSDIMTLNTNSVLKERLEVENEFLKKENKKLEEENKALERKILENEFSDSKASGNKEMVKEFVNGFAPLITMFMQNKSAGGALNAPAQNLSLEKQQFISVITNPEFSNENVLFLLDILNSVTTIDGFYEKLEELLNTTKNA
ncbi:MAG: hypothetical protein CMP76_08015 [Flavobacterium sp.]|uniref:hypothetical protein n=1 Tax=Flavobacterium sp. TaxID=239 RepID=UPI000C3A6B46|nr:hypothetical protein [Flavobacterium sp.]MBF03226.1 hypothetical protein [Flavobacterium sp.]|tara:strand:- start:561 stop:1325 length:765 start_codon:yes stop_codon:yes gene_type:complete